MYESMQRNESSCSFSKLTKRVSSSQGGRIVSRKLSLIQAYGGLGTRYYERLGHDLDKIFQVDVPQSHTETRGSVRGRSIQLALEMRSRGVSERDIIVICSKNNGDQVVVLLATLFLGAIVAPLDPEYNNSEMSQLLRDLKPKLCFGDIRTATHLERILHTLNYNTEVFSFTPESSGKSSFSKLFHHKEDEFFRPKFIDDTRRNVAFILPTQGTTGTPKLICLSHDNICLQCSVFEDILEFPNMIISFFPLSWILQTILTCVCLDSSSTLIIPGSFAAKSACKIIHDFEIGYAILGTDYAMKLAESVAVRDYNIKCLKCVIIGIVDTSKYDIRQLKSMMPEVKFLPLYCMVETGCIAAARVKDYSTSLTKPSDTVGRLTLNCKVKVVDIITKELCGPYVYGELYFNGDGLMLGYFKDKERTINSLDKGYFKTGDMGKFDEDGWLYISGRIEDLVQFDKWSLIPTDLEDAFSSHEKVKDAVVIGNNKEVIAIVKKISEAVLTISDLKKFICHKLPEKYWPNEIIMLQHFPRTSIGSVKKNKLREEYLLQTMRVSSSLAIDKHEKK